MNDDRDLQQIYRQARSDDKQAPDFETMWTRAHLQSKPVTQPPARLAFAAAAVVVVTAATLGAFLITNAPDHDDALASFVLDLEQEQALALLEWEAPTDFLLSTDDDWFYEP